MSQLELNDQEIISTFVEEQELVLEKDVSRLSERYNFDFAEEAPIQTPNASFKYESIKMNETPANYHCRQIKEMNNK